MKNAQATLCEEYTMKEIFQEQIKYFKVVSQSAEELLESK
jgi:hypothetical protein